MNGEQAELVNELSELASTSFNIGIRFRTRQPVNN